MSTVEGLPGAAGSVSSGSPGAAGTPRGLPEAASVWWRPRADEGSLARSERAWLLSTVFHTVPFLVAAAVLLALSPWTAPVALACLAHAWAIPSLYANRGAKVVRPRPRRGWRPAPGAERVAVGLLGDLVDHAARDLHRATGLVLERGRHGVWLVGESGALLVRPGGRRVHCYCVGVPDPDLPGGDRIAHLLLALRADERDFVTIANLAFAGARWRVRRRLPAPMRPALDRAARAAAGS